MFDNKNLRIDGKRLWESRLDATLDACNKLKQIAGIGNNL
jgi:hypothetical protein